MNNKVLFVIDVQNGYMPLISHKSQFVREINHVIAESRKKNIPIFFFRYLSTEKDKNRFGTILTPSESKSSHIVEMLDCRKTDTVYVKTEYSAFTVPTLSDDLEKRRVTEIILCGVMAHVCILATSIDAYERGYRVTVVKNAITATSKENLAFGLAWMKKYTADVV